MEVEGVDLNSSTGFAISQPREPGQVTPSHLRFSSVKGLLRSSEPQHTRNILPSKWQSGLNGTRVRMGDRSLIFLRLGGSSPYHSLLVG